MLLMVHWEGQCGLIRQPEKLRLRCWRPNALDKSVLIQEQRHIWTSLWVFEFRPFHKNIVAFSSEDPVADVRIVIWTHVLSPPTSRSHPRPM